MLWASILRGVLKNQHTDLSGDIASAGTCLKKKVYFFVLHFFTCSFMHYQEYSISKLWAILLQESTVGAGCSVRSVTQFSTNCDPNNNVKVVYLCLRMVKKFCSASFTLNILAVHHLLSISCRMLVGFAGQSSLRNVTCPVTFRATVWEHYGCPVSITVAM